MITRIEKAAEWRMRGMAADVRLADYQPFFRRRPHSGPTGTATAVGTTSPTSSSARRYSVILGYLDVLGGWPSILDVGCGAGALCERIGNRAFSSYVGIDIAEDAIRAVDAMADDSTLMLLTAISSTPTSASPGPSTSRSASRSSTARSTSTRCSGGCTSCPSGRAPAHVEHAALGRSGAAADDRGALRPRRQRRRAHPRVARPPARVAHHVPPSALITPDRRAVEPRLDVLHRLGEHPAEGLLGRRSRGAGSAASAARSAAGGRAAAAPRRRRPAPRRRCAPSPGRRRARARRRWGRATC